MLCLCLPHWVGNSLKAKPVLVWWSPKWDALSYQKKISRNVYMFVSKLPFIKLDIIKHLYMVVQQRAYNYK